MYKKTYIKRHTSRIYVKLVFWEDIKQSCLSVYREVDLPVTEKYQHKNDFGV
jgi:hypothetical protein